MFKPVPALAGRGFSALRHTLEWLARPVTLALFVAGLMAGCAGLPRAVERLPSTTLVAPAQAPLAQVAGDAGAPAHMLACRPLPQPEFALDARVQMLRRASTSIALQTYHLANDSVGQLMLRELRDAAARGVRVRLLLDDFYTEGLDDVLLALAAHRNVEVRLFNPFASARASFVGRLWQLATGFDRLNHRMHNKLLLADGMVALAGGRNLTDEYFFRSQDGNFIDLDVLMVGAILPELNRLFDLYWNSDPVLPLQAVANNGLDGPSRRASFDRLTDEALVHSAPTTADAFGRPSFGAELDLRQHHWLIAPGGAAADNPDKLLAHRMNVKDSLRSRFTTFIESTKSELIIASPYYVPGRQGIAQLQALRDRGVSVQVFTNSTAASDEPLVNTGLARYRVELLHMGVRLYEVASTRLKRNLAMRLALGRSTGRLHAKLGVIDRSQVLFGSMNMDPRSDHTNTEIGVGIRSPALAQELVSFFQIDDPRGVYELKLKPDGKSVQWVANDADDPHGDERHDQPPGTSWGTRLRLFLMSFLVSEELL